MLEGAPSYVRAYLSPAHPILSPIVPLLSPIGPGLACGAASLSDIVEWPGMVWAGRSGPRCAHNPGSKPPFPQTARVPPSRGQCSRCARSMHS